MARVASGYLKLIFACVPIPGQTGGPKALDFARDYYLLSSKYVHGSRDASNQRLSTRNDSAPAWIPASSSVRIDSLALEQAMTRRGNLVTS